MVRYLVRIFHRFRLRYRSFRDQYGYFGQLVWLCFALLIGFSSAIFFTAQYGPFAVLGAVSIFVGFYWWKNESRKHQPVEAYDDKPPPEKWEDARRKYIEAEMERRKEQP